MNKSRTAKHYRKFGPVTVISGKEVKEVLPEQYLRIRPDTGAVVTDDEGRSKVVKVDKGELSSNKFIAPKRK